MIVSSVALAANIDSTATRLGVPLPPAYVTAVAEARALPRDVDFSGATAALNAVAIQAMREGREVGADPQVQKLAAEVVLAAAGIRAAATSWAGDHITELVNTHANDIVAGWAQAIRGDLDTLEAAGAKLDMPDLNIPDTVALRRAGLLDLWAQASTSSERADAAIAGLRSILRCVHIGFDGPTGNALLIAPDADISTLTAIGARAGRGTLTSWSAARCGAPLRLPTVTEYTQAVARVSAERQQRERDADADADADAKPEGRQRQRQWVKVR